MRHTSALLEYLDCPESLGIYLLIKNGQWDDVVRYDVDPLRYLDTVSGARKYFLAASARALVSKRRDLPTTFDRDQVAFETWSATEAHCCTYNHMLSALLPGSPLRGDFGPHLAILAKGRKWLLRTWGPVPDSLHGRHGPGVSVETRGSRPPVVADKMTDWSVTSSALPIWAHLTASEGLGRVADEIRSKVVRGNELTFVPKSSKTSRTIAIEPGGNVYCQLAVGGFLKHRLARVGLGVAPSDDLDLHKRIVDGRWEAPEFLDGQLLHRQKARIGSADGSLATIDFSSASGCISRVLVSLLLEGTIWLDVLASLRSPFTKLPKKFGGAWVRAEAFSTMGNGFTFELLTSVICALVHGATGLIPGKDFWVYGDDLIVPSEHASLAQSVLSGFGFIPNVSKSYTSGLFRESCGGDYFCGLDVRPKFLKSEPTGADPLALVDFHNTFSWQPTAAAARVRRELRREVPRSLRFEHRRARPYCFLTRRTTLSRTEGGVYWVRGLTEPAELIPLDRWGFVSWRMYAQVLLRTRAAYPTGVRGGPWLSTKGGKKDFAPAWFADS